MTIPQPAVHIIGTGGTIHSVGNGPLDYHNYGTSGHEKLTIGALLEQLPAGHDLPPVRWEQMFQQSSQTIGPAEWLDLTRRIHAVSAQQPETSGFVVTHGTNTLEETAFFLHLTVKSDRPVVVTGAMRPPSAIGSDAPANLVSAIRVAAAPQSRAMGVLTVLNDEIHSARDVRKTNTYRVETFQSGEFGILGYADADHAVVYYRRPFRKHTFETEFDVADLTALPKVAIAYAYAGGDGDSIRAALAGGAAGIVSAGVGAGSGAPDYIAALEEAAARGVPVVIGSHVGSGRVMMTDRWAPHGVIVADTHSPKKSRILLMLGLTVTQERERLQAMFATY